MFRERARDGTRDGQRGRRRARGGRDADASRRGRPFGPFRGGPSNQVLQREAGGRHRSRARRQTGSGGRTSSGTNREPAAGIRGDVRSHLSTADAWRRRAVAWLREHHRRCERNVDAFRRRPDRDPIPLGRELYGQLRLLDAHFSVGERLPGLGVPFPDGPGTAYDGSQYRAIAYASGEILSRFEEVTIRGLGFDVAEGVAPGDGGADVIGTAEAGSGAFTIYGRAWGVQTAGAKTATVLHEAFHASFGNFLFDAYYGDSDYPPAAGRAFANADSYATFASVVVTGKPNIPVVAPLDTTISVDPSDLSGSTDGR